MTDYIIHIFPEQAVRFPGRRQRFYIRLVSVNGRTINVSQAYATHWNAKRAARKVFPDFEIKEMPE